MQTEVQTKTEVLLKEKNVFVVILNNVKFKEYKILNNAMQNYILSGISYPFKVLEYKEEDIRKIIKPYLKKGEIIVVLFANTPLVLKQTIENIIEYSRVKNINACKLPCGFVFNSSYIKKNKIIAFDSFYSQNEDEFLEVVDDESLKIATEILQARIIKYHAKNGVKFENEQAVVVEPTAEIQSGVVISSNCIIQGNSTILNSAIIKENTAIINSEVGRGSSVSNSQILNTIIGNQAIIMPYCYISNSKIGNSVLIKSNKCLEGVSIEDNKTIE